MFGLDVDTLRGIQGAIAAVEPIEKVLIYGSRAKGNYKIGSDIDITLMGRNLTLYNSIHPLYQQLDELLLPYMFDISILKQIDDLNVVEHILRVGKVFYERPDVTTSHHDTKAAKAASSKLDSDAAANASTSSKHLYLWRKKKSKPRRTAPLISQTTTKKCGGCFNARSYRLCGYNFRPFSHQPRF